MNPTAIPASRLHDPFDRAVAKLAVIARSDTVLGGARAMVIEGRLFRMGSRVADQGIVRAVYSSSSGRHHRTFEAWECPECGAAHLGIAAAYACCREDES